MTHTCWNVPQILQQLTEECILTYPDFVWLIRRSLDLMIEFIEPSYDWLQQFTNLSLRHCHLLLTGHSAGTILTSIWTSLYSIVLLQFLSDLRVESSLILRPSVSRPVCLGRKHPSGAYDQIFVTVRQLRVCWFGALSLTKGQVCRLQMLLVLASAVILRSESRGTHGHILLSQIRDFPFAAFYDFQGYGGGIRTRLHTR
jgi:hypothetical protein